MCVAQRIVYRSELAAFGIYPSFRDSHKNESTMLQWQDLPILGKKTLKQTPNNLGLTAKDIFIYYAPESSSCLHLRTGIP